MADVSFSTDNPEVAAVFAALAIVSRLTSPARGTAEDLAVENATALVAAYRVIRQAQLDLS